MHTQHVKFCAYVAGGAGVGPAVAVVLVIEEGEVSGLVEDDDDDRSVLEVVVVVVSVLPSPSLLLVVCLTVLLDCIGTTVGLIVFAPCVCSPRPCLFRGDLFCSRKVASKSKSDRKPRTPYNYLHIYSNVTCEVVQLFVVPACYMYSKTYCCSTRLCPILSRRSASSHTCSSSSNSPHGPSTKTPQVPLAGHDCFGRSARPCFLRNPPR